MAAEAVIGTTFVFQVLFVDELQNPIAVNSPEVDIYYFTALGDRVDLVAGGVMTPVVPAELGRYVFPFAIATTFNDGDTLYGKMSGINPSTLLSTHIEQTVNLVAASRASGGSGSSGCGMRASFVKGGGGCG
jgi:hypothetical protein